MVVHGPGRTAALLDDADALAPGLDHRIRCAISGFGDHGPLADLPARDVLVAAHLGLCADQTGWQPGPSYLVHHVPSVGAGLLAVQGILAALLVRRRTGHGQRVATSLFAAALAMSGRVEAGQPFRDRGLSTRPRGTSPLYSVYACADDRWIQFGCLHAGFVERAVATLGIESAVAPLRTDPGFGDGVSPTTESVREPFYAAVAAAVATRPRAAWLAAFEAADVPVAAVLESEAYLDTEQGRANGFAAIEDPVLGRIEMLGPAVRLGRTPARVRAGRPALGQPRDGGGRSPDAVLSASYATDAATPPVEASIGASGPLEGLVVVEIANVIAGPMTGRYLADLGARVIKLESVEGDIFRQQDVPEFRPLNAGKHGIALDLKTTEGRDIALRLLERADVLVNNLRPGAAERLGLGDSAVRTRSPGLVYCQVSAFGTSGPEALRAGGDPLAGAYTGMQAAQGGAGDPVYVRGAPIDYTAALLATTGILLALVARDRSGLGQPVETSLLDAGALLNAPGMVRWAGRPRRDDRAASQYHRDALVGLYAAHDGWLAISVESDREWAALAAALGEPALDGDPAYGDTAARIANDAALTDEIGRRIASDATDRWLAQFRDTGVPAAPVRAPVGLGLRDPAIVDNGLVADVVDPDLGPIRLAHGWIQLSGSRVGCRSGTPRLGADTDAILAELGIVRDAPGAEAVASAPSGDPADDRHHGCDAGPDRPRDRTVQPAHRSRGPAPLRRDDRGPAAVADQRGCGREQPIRRPRGRPDLPHRHASARDAGDRGAGDHDPVRERRRRR